MVIARFDIYLVTLDPTEGYEMKKTRPCVSPDEMYGLFSFPRGAKECLPLLR
jgi:mRNA interferase MazF